MHSLARWVSIVLHPFVTALALVAAIELDRGATDGARTVGVVAALIVVPVGLLTLLQYRRGAWSTVDASQKSERPMLFGVGAAGMLALLLFFASTRRHAGYVTGVSGVLAMILACAAITPWLKVSLHLATAAVAATVLATRGMAIGVLLAVLLPLLAWSRVRLRRHTVAEVVVGAAIGIVTGVLIARFT